MVYVVALAKPVPGPNPSWHFPSLAQAEAGVLSIAKERNLSARTGLIIVGPFPDAWLGTPIGQRKTIDLSWESIKDG